MYKTSTFFYWGPYLVRYITDPKLAQEFLIKTNISPLEKTANHALASLIKDVKFIDKELAEWFVHNVFGSCMSHYKNTLIEHFGLFFGHNPADNYNGLYNRIIKGTPHITDMWLNKQLRTESNPVHNHSQDFSFVYYLQIPEKLIDEYNDYSGTGVGPGTITFKYGEISNNNWAKVVHTFVPAVGELFIFPAQLEHFVQPFYTCKEARISVSGNILFA